MIPDQEIPKDKILPQLADVLDPTKMKDVFQKELFKDPRRFQIQACSIERVKYKPGKNCLICYQLDIFDHLTRQITKQRLSTRIFEKGGALSRFKKAQSQSMVVPCFGEPVSHLPTLDMVIWTFPNDRKLPELPKIIDPIFLKEKIFPDLIRTVPGPDWIVSQLSSDIVHYVPEQTCTVRVSLQLQNMETNQKKTMTLYGKTYYNEEGREAYRMMGELWRSDLRRAERLKMAEPAGYDPETKTLWQLGLPGTTLLDQTMSAPRFFALLEGAASTVAALHHSSLSCANSVRLPDLLVQLEGMKRFLSEASPLCQETLCSLVNRLIDQSSYLKEQSDVTLHGDLHFKNFIVDGDDVFLIDLDNLCHGAPLQDIGSFLAGMLYRGLMTHVPGEQLDEIGNQFIKEYEKRVPWTVSRWDLGWYIAAALINQRAFRCVTRLKAGRRDILEHLIGMADRISFGWNEVRLKG